MAYSNVTPPPLPEYDTETYGYYVLAFNYRIGEEDWYQVQLYYSAWRFHYEEGLGITNSGNTFWRIGDDESWSEELRYQETLALNPGVTGITYQRIYTNANIFNGNEIYLAENSVTPVEGAKFPLLDYVKGLIMGYCSPRRALHRPEFVGYLYGHVAKKGEQVPDGLSEYTIDGERYIGAVLPELPEWDTTAYPYVSIHFNARVGFYDARALKAKGYMKRDTAMDGETLLLDFFPNTHLCISNRTGLWGSSWSAYTSIIGITFERNSEKSCVFVWSNYDIKYQSGSTYFAKCGDPIPIYE